MRTKNSLINIIASLGGYSLFIVISFITRYFFVNSLDEVFLGLNGLFTNIISVLSLAELGFGTAVTYSLYEPLASNNKNKIRSLMALYKKAYLYISVIIAILGFVITPIIPYIVNSNENITNIYIYYWLFVINASVSYMISYKRSIIIADQKNYIVSLYHYFIFIVMNILQITSLLLFENYIMYLIIRIVFTAIENYIISNKANKLYPFIKDKTIDKLDRNEINSIIDNIKALFIQKVGVKLVLSTDNIIISRFVGIYWVGLYSNYYLITGTLHVLSEQILSSITASVGNLNINESKEKKFEIYNTLFFVNFVAFSFLSVITLVIINDFITIWIGIDFVLNFNIVSVLIINFYITGMRKVNMLFKNAFGLFLPLRHFVFVEVIINIVISIALANRLGILGVFIGTFFSTILIPFWVEPYVIFKYAFEEKLSNYYLKYFKYTCVFIFVSVLSYSITNFIPFVGISSIILKLVIVCIVISITFLICFSKTPEFKMFLNICRRYIFKPKKSSL